MYFVEPEPILFSLLTSTRRRHQHRLLQAWTKDSSDTLPGVMALYYVITSFPRQLQLIEKTSDPFFLDPSCRLCGVEMMLNFH